MLALTLTLSTRALAQLTLAAPTPLVRDEPATLVATGAAPGATVTFAASTRQGLGPCPAPLGGLCLDLVAPTVLGTAVAGAGGVAVLQLRVPAAAPLVDASLQAAHGGPSPAVSPVLEAPVLRIVTAYDTLNVIDDRTLEEARHTLRVDGYLAFQNGGYARAVELPHLASIDGALYLTRGGDLSVAAPRLTSADGTLILNSGQAVQLSAPALATLGNLQVSGIVDATIDLPALHSVAHNVDLAYLGSLTFSAPTLATAETLGISSVSGPIALDLPALDTLGWGLNLTQLPVTTLDGWFPALGTVGSRVGVTANAALTDVDGLDRISAPDAVISGNPALPSCDAAATIEAITAAAPGPYACSSNAPDTCSDAPGDVCWR